MRSRGALKRWPITSQQRAAMRTAQQRLAQVFEHGSTSEQIAQAQAEVEADKHPRQPQLALRVRS